MPPMTKKNSAATAHTSLRASNRSPHVERSPGGPQAGSRQVM